MTRDGAVRVQFPLKTGEVPYIGKGVHLFLIASFLLGTPLGLLATKRD